MASARRRTLAALLLVPALTAADVAGKAEAFDRVEVLHVVLAGDGFAVLLVERGREVVLPIFIGPAEGLAIEMRLKKQQAPRPSTHDLLEDVIEALGAKLVRVEVSKVEGSVFFGRLVLDQKGKRVTLDARPSDSIAVALGAGAPIHVARGVLEHAGVPLKQFRDEAEKPVERAPQPGSESL